MPLNETVYQVIYDWIKENADWKMSDSELEALVNTPSIINPEPAPKVPVAIQPSVIGDKMAKDGDIAIIDGERRVAIGFTEAAAAEGVVGVLSVEGVDKLTAIEAFVDACRSNDRDLANNYMKLLVEFGAFSPEEAEAFSKRSNEEIDDPNHEALLPPSRVLVNNVITQGDIAGVRIKLVI